MTSSVVGPKLTFKKDKRPTGLGAGGDPNPDTHVKINGTEIGCIRGPNWRSADGTWSITIAFPSEPTEARPAPFKWCTFKVRHDSEAKAREWLVENLPHVIKQLGMPYAFGR